jgi:hypothetical protein
LVHTESGRHEININYGNPYQKFGDALQKVILDVINVRTRSQRKLSMGEDLAIYQKRKFSPR